jgi:hypothetical protein
VGNPSILDFPSGGGGCFQFLRDLFFGFCQKILAHTPPHSMSAVATATKTMEEDQKYDDGDNPLPLSHTGLIPLHSLLTFWGDKGTLPPSPAFSLTTLHQPPQVATLHRFLK